MYITAYSIFHSFQVTLSRAMGALSIWQKMKLAWHLITTKDPIRYLHRLSALVRLYWAVCYTCVPLCLKWNSKEYKEYCLVQLLVKVKAIFRDSSLKHIHLLAIYCDVTTCHFTFMLMTPNYIQPSLTTMNWVQQYNDTTSRLLSWHWYMDDLKQT